jgi:hypothetical protein
LAGTTYPDFLPPSLVGTVVELWMRVDVPEHSGTEPFQNDFGVILIPHDEPI